MELRAGERRDIQDRRQVHGHRFYQPLSEVGARRAGRAELGCVVRKAVLRDGVLHQGRGFGAAEQHRGRMECPHAGRARLFLPEFRAETHREQGVRRLALVHLSGQRPREREHRPLEPRFEQGHGDLGFPVLYAPAGQYGGAERQRLSADPLLRRNKTDRL